MIEPISALTGYALGISQNASWDLLKHVAMQLTNRGGLNLDKLFLEALYTAIDVHNQHYDEASGDTLLELKRRVSNDSALLFNGLKEFQYEDFGIFMANIENEDFQRRLAIKLNELYFAKTAVENPITVQILTDALSYYKDAFFARVTSDQAVLLILGEAIESRNDITLATKLLNEIKSLIETLQRDRDVTNKRIPLWYPRSNNRFINRTKEVDRLARALQENKVVGIFGMGGVGKTALANKVVHQLTEKFKSRGVLWDPNGPPSLSRFLEMVIQSYERVPTDYLDGTDSQDKLKLRAKGLLLQDRPLICIDDIHEGSLVKQVAEIASSCPILVTSRRHLDTAIYLLDEVVDLEELDPSEALKLLYERLDYSPNHVNENVLMDICRTVGFLPLAIEIVAARMKIGHVNPGQMLDRLRQRRKSLDILEIEDKSVRASFEVSYEDLSSDEKIAFCIFGLFTGTRSIDRELVISTLRSAILNPELLLENLASRSFVKISETIVSKKTIIDIHPLFAVFAQEKMDTGQQRMELSQSIARSLLSHVSQLPWAERKKMIVDIKAIVEWCLSKGEIGLQIQSLNVIGDILLRDVKTYRTELDAYQFSIQSVLAVAKRTGVVEHEARLSSQMAVVNHATGNLEQALNWQENAFNLYKRLGDVHGAGISLLNLGTLNKETGALDTAIGCYTKALHLFQSSLNQRGIIEANTSLSDIYANLSNIPLAETSFEEALEGLDSLGDRISQADLSSLVDLMLPMAIRQDQYTKAFDYIERSKKTISSHLSIPLPDIRHLLSGIEKRRVVMAEYYMTEDATFLFIVRSDFDSPEVIEIKITRDEIRRYVAENFGLIGKDEIYGSYSAVQSLDFDDWQTRFEPFIMPITKFAEVGDIVWIVPHDALHYLPFHALSVEGQYLIERNPVVYTPSASIMKYCQAKRKGRREKALVLGDSASDRPLPYAREEAFRVAELFGTQPYVGKAARKSIIKEELEKRREEIDIIHFACHGKFNPFQVLKSGILMAPESDNEEKPVEFEVMIDGLPVSRYLTVEEILELELHAELVTLGVSASGVNEIRPGDELVGLTSAFINAGTSSVVSSLWEVNDISTELFMVHFYERLKSGDAKVEALQKAQHYIKNISAGEAKAYFESKASKSATINSNFHQKQIGEAIQSIYRKLLDAEEREGHPLGLDYQIFNHPFYWAPFTLTGDWD